MPTLIHRRVAAAQQGDNPYVIGRVASGWLVMGDVQFLEGYCLILADPVVESLNALTPKERSGFLEDMTAVGDVLLEVTEAYRINYEILGNGEPALHAHIFPRYYTEPEERRKQPAWFYDWKRAPAYSEAYHGTLKQRIRDSLARRGRLADLADRSGCA